MHKYFDNYKSISSKWYIEDQNIWEILVARLKLTEEYDTFSHEIVTYYRAEFLEQGFV